MSPLTVKSGAKSPVQTSSQIVDIRYGSLSGGDSGAGDSLTDSENGSKPKIVKNIYTLSKYKDRPTFTTFMDDNSSVQIIEDNWHIS